MKSPGLRGWTILAALAMAAVAGGQTLGDFAVVEKVKQHTRG